MSLYAGKGVYYGYGVQVTNVATAVAASAGLRVRKEGSLPSLKPGMEPSEARILRGKWGNYGADVKTGRKTPTWDMPGILRVGLMDLLLGQVMAEAAPDVDDNIAFTLNATTTVQPSVTTHLSIWQRNENIATQDERLTGAVVKSIKLSGSSEQQRVNADVSFIGVDFDKAIDGSAGTYTAPTEAWLLHSAMTFKIGAGTIKNAEFDLTIDFGTTPFHDNSLTPQEFLLGELKVDGTIRCPWIDDDVLGDALLSSENTMTFLWGAAAASGYLEITVPVKYLDPEKTINNFRLDQTIPIHYEEAAAQALAITLQV
jgi:hypothetical protein